MSILSKLFGVSKKEDRFDIPVAAQRPVTGRRSRHADHPSKAMRRGVQTALERKQRPRRLAFIAESSRQAKEVREQELIKREVRAELRKAA